MPIKVQLFRPGEDSPAYEEYFGHGQEPDQEFVNFPPVPNSGRRHFVYPITKVRGFPVHPNPNTMSHYGWWRCDVTLKGEQPANICFHSKSFIKKLVTKQTKISTRWLKHSLETALKALTPRVSIKKDELKIELFREISESVKDIPPIIIKEQLQLSTISATGNIELITISANPQCARDVRLVYERKIEVLESYKKSIQDDGSLVFQQKEALKAPYQRKIDFYQDNLLNMMKTYVNDDDLTIAFSAFFSNPTLEIDIPIFNNPILTLF